MVWINKFAWCMACILLCSFSLEGFFPARVDAALATVESKMIVDSVTDPYNQRIYSYDIQVDAQGDVHIIYSKPTGVRTADIYYVRRMGGAWQDALPLSSKGLRGSISTFLAVEANGLIHVCYIKDEGATEALYYRTIVNGSPTTESKVDNGGWHTGMQLDGNGSPVFIREHDTKLALIVKTDDTWTKELLESDTSPTVPPGGQFRLADFLFANGVYHITYGDTLYQRDVWNGKASSVRVEDGKFHNFYYATSPNGQNWTQHKIDDTGTLYENEFWNSLVLDGGSPIIAMYKYAEYPVYPAPGSKYNTGTSAILMKLSGGMWQKQTITNTQFADSREGMGVGLVVNGSGDIFGAWDFSPDSPDDDDFHGARGNVALVRSGSANDWTLKWQVDPFSLEGRAKLRIHGAHLFFLGLGDHVDTKLYFREYDISNLGSVTPPPPPPPSGDGRALPATYFLLR